MNALHPFDAICTRHLTAQREAFTLRAMMSLAHIRWHRSSVEETASAAVCLRADRDSSKRSPLFAQFPANGKEPGP